MGNQTNKTLVFSPMRTTLVPTCSRVHRWWRFFQAALQSFSAVGSDTQCLCFTLSAEKRCCLGWLSRIVVLGWLFCCLGWLSRMIPHNFLGSALDILDSLSRPGRVLNRKKLCTASSGCSKPRASALCLRLTEAPMGGRIRHPVYSPGECSGDGFDTL